MALKARPIIHPLFCNMSNHPDHLTDLEETGPLEKGQVISVWWGGDAALYEARVVSSVNDEGCQVVHYADGDGASFTATLNVLL